jgi:DNA-binding FadR family transcriptional regulator
MTQNETLKVGTMQGSRGYINDNVANLLGGEIVSGVYREGERLPCEAALLARFQVSRPTLREALRTLTSKHLIVARKKVGAIVRPKAQWNAFDPEVIAWRLRSPDSRRVLADLSQLREVLALHAAPLAAGNASPMAIGRIGEALAGMERCSREGGDMRCAQDGFRQALLAATGNALIAELGAVVDGALRSIGPDGESASPPEGADSVHAVARHKALLTAVRTGDVDGARSCALQLAPAPVAPAKMVA